VFTDGTIEENKMAADMQPQLPEPGRYRHFKGGYYRVLTLAWHSETREQLVIYQSEQDGVVYARPLAIFMGSAEDQGQAVSRFARVASQAGE
jgi:hypothetical protein